MPDKVFVDTNILIYGFSSDEPDKRSIAINLGGKASDVVISTQVLLEVSNVLNRTIRLDWNQISKIVKNLSAEFFVHINTQSTILTSHAIAARYGFSLFDALIIAAALETKCTVLFSDDLQNGQVIEKTLTVKNPFKVPR